MTGPHLKHQLCASYQSKKLGAKPITTALRQRDVTDLGRLPLTCGILDLPK
jgi:hypothetical protein